MEHILVIIALLGLYYFYRYYYRDDGRDYSPVMNTNAKVINPDAPHSADWKFDMRECYYNAAGTMVRKGKRINGYKELERKYGLSLINAKGLD